MVASTGSITAYFRPMSWPTLRGSTFQGGGKTRPSGWSVFAYQALKRRRSELAQTLLIGRWRPMSSFDKSQTKKKKKRKTTAKKVAMITTKTATATRFENY